MALKNTRAGNYPEWYQNVVSEADMAENSSSPGCMVIKPWGYGIWERIRDVFDEKIKSTDHENCYFPMFIPLSFFQKEAEHVDGFAKEMAVVTHSRLSMKDGKLVPDSELDEPLIVRPTSEAIIADSFSKWVKSYRDLPVLVNQWANVVRWEMRPRLFLRTREFLWQEGHTAHATAEEAEARTIQMLNVYADFCEDVLAIPVIKGRKTDKEKFAGAEATYTIESLMHDGKALQSGTSHNFGDGFARAFGVQYTDKDNKLQYVHQTSWGMTTRMIGAIIMVHGDDSGLVLPPKVAPTQIMIVPIMQKKEGVLEKAEELRSVLASNFRVKVDDSDKSPGFKFAEQEVKGIPLRVEVGPKDIEAGQAVVVRRDTREKTIVPFDKLSETCEALLAQMHDDMYAKAKAHRDANTHVATNWDEFTDILEKKQGFIKAMWCGEEACETAIKDETGATTRCIPFAQEKLGDVCVHCGKPAKHMVYFGKAY